VSESTDRWRKAARAAVRDARRVADKHLPVLRESTKAVIQSELPKVAAAIRREFESRRKG
jgi:hypothetical protein